MEQNFKIPEDKKRHGTNYVCARYGTDDEPVHPTTLFRWIKRGVFPKPDKINGVRSWTGKVLDDYDEQLRLSQDEVA